jgi:hypothetical protein
VVEVEEPTLMTLLAEQVVQVVVVLEGQTLLLQSLEQ